jgi:signal transduction histidine kinase/ligand-binding sensor domain-containing protein/DNA-binding response OmpR family regulator
MKLSRLALPFLLLLSVLTFGSNSESPDFSFRRISPVGGFTYGSINSIGEDSFGFIWFGTIHGLYRYNTVSVQKFTHDSSDSTSIPSNSIRTIYNDNNGALWIGTAYGLAVYDDRKDKFIRKRFQDESGEYLGNNMCDIFRGKGKSLYFLSSIMLGRLDLETNKFEKIFADRTLHENFVAAATDSKGNIWIGGSDGTVWLYNISTKIVKTFCHHRDDAIRKIFVDQETIWIGYSLTGLDCTSMEGTLIKHYGSNPDDQYKIHHNRIRDIFKDETGRMWIATYKGISIIDQGKINNMLPHEISGIPYSSIYKIFRDSKNGIWIGTWSGGLAYQSNFDNRFAHSEKERTDTDLDDEFVSSFTEKSDGTILIGTEFGNLNKLDRLANKMIKIPLLPDNGKKIENIKSLLFDGKTDVLWIGTFLEGLWYQKKNETILHRFKSINDSRVSVYALAKADNGIWIGTFGTGLYYLDDISGNLKHFITASNDSTTISSNSIRAIEVAKDKSLWIGTNNGLNRLDPVSGKFTRYIQKLNSYDPVRNDEILCLKEDRKGNLWIGTSGRGLIVFNPKEHLLKSFQIKDGLIGNDVYGIEEDNNGILWISTENGISSVDPDLTSIRNFNRNDELLGNQFNPGSHFLSSAGEILFGDTKGFILFSPNKMKANPVPPKVILTSLNINNKLVDIHAKDSPLDQSIFTTTELKLSYHQNSLTFNFVANNFVLPNKNKFKYRLANYDNNWIDAGSQNYATFTKIPPGSYTFEVLACNNDNVWSEVPTKIRIAISPPFWFSWYAYLIYLVLLFIVIYFIRKEVKERERFKKELLLERLLHESDAQLQEMKLRFFTNISHEFRTPLTLIVSPINLLLEKFNLETIVREHLQTIQRNSDRLLRLINQVIDVHKIESGKTVFQPVISDLISLCNEVIHCFEMEARDKNILLTFSSEFDELEVCIDPDKVEKIFFNILSNAMKFTGENGIIRISVSINHPENLSEKGITIGDSIDGDRVSVEFSDNGPGIAKEDILLIFERFGQGKNHHTSGTGIGLHMASEYIRLHHGNIHLESNPNEGSSFTINLPVSYDLVINQKEVAEITQLEESINNKVHQPKENNISEKSINETILIIEDNFELRTYLKNILRSKYRIVTAPNGKQGVETALTVLPDLVISDVMMPQMDGFEVCRYLKNNILSSHIPIILLTALSDTDKKIGGYSSGADAYVTKPFDEKILLAQIENLIRSRAKLRDVFSVSDSEWASGMAHLNSDKLLIEKAGTIVEQHLNDKNFIVDHLAAKLNISTSSLYRKLKSLTNQSPTEFVRYIRLKKAIKLMTEGNSNVDEIGFAIGFNSHSYFTSSFKKQFGMTPSEYLHDLKLNKK